MNAIKGITKKLNFLSSNFNREQGSLVMYDFQVK